MSSPVYNLIVFVFGYFIPMGTITYSLMYGIYHQRKIQQNNKMNQRQESLYSSSVLSLLIIDIHGRGDTNGQVGQIWTVG